MTPILTLPLAGGGNLKAKPGRKRQHEASIPPPERGRIKVGVI
jgi:hypothetical protein